MAQSRLTPWQATLRSLGEGLADILFPPICVVCRAPAPRHLCDACIAGITRVERPICHRCGRGFDALKLPERLSFAEQATCKRCRELPPDFDLCRAYGLYPGPLGGAIRAVKYERCTAAVSALAGLLHEVLRADPVLSTARVLVPVPLHPRRQRQRGFNQSELLARALGAEAGLDVRSLLLAKVRNTRPQVGLNAEQRRENLRDAYQPHGPALPDGPFLLVDDVITTGATFHECARALKTAGARHVFAVALAQD